MEQKLKVKLSLSRHLTWLSSDDDNLVAYDQSYALEMTSMLKAWLISNDNRSIYKCISSF